MITPLIVSKLVFVLGVLMLGFIVWRKMGVVRTVPHGAEAQESFRDFLTDRSETVVHHLTDAYNIASRAILRVAFASLHSVKLLSLKLESRTTHWLSHVQKVSEKAKEQKEKKMILEEVVAPVISVKTDIISTHQQLKSPEFFPLLKDTPNHDKLKNKLSLMKEEAKEGQKVE